MNPEQLEQKIADLEKTNSAILSLLRKIMDPEGKITINMTIEDLIVSVNGKSSVTFDVSTGTIEGKIMLCALKDIERASLFTFSGMSKALDNRGWHTSDGSLAPALSRMVGKGLLIKENGGYRLPLKVTYTGEAI